VEIRDPNGIMVILNQVNVGTDKTYSTTITANTSLWQATGAYTVYVQLTGTLISATTTFNFGGTPSAPHPSQPIIPLTSSPSSQGCVKPTFMNYRTDYVWTDKDHYNQGDTVWVCGQLGLSRGQTTVDLTLNGGNVGSTTSKNYDLGMVQVSGDGSSFAKFFVLSGNTFFGSGGYGISAQWQAGSYPDGTARYMPISGWWFSVGNVTDKLDPFQIVINKTAQGLPTYAIQVPDTQSNLASNNLVITRLTSPEGFVTRITNPSSVPNFTPLPPLSYGTSEIQTTYGNNISVVQIENPRPPPIILISLDKPSYVKTEKIKFYVAVDNKIPNQNGFTYNITDPNRNTILSNSSSLVSQINPNNNLNPPEISNDIFIPSNSFPNIDGTYTVTVNYQGITKTATFYFANDLTNAAPITLKDKESCQAFPFKGIWNDTGSTCIVSNGLVVNSGYTVAINSGVTLATGYIENHGTINNIGTITNLELPKKNIPIDDLISIFGIEIKNFEKINNSGKIIVMGSITNDKGGTMINSGNITFEGGTFDNEYGVINNSGTINILGLNVTSNFVNSGNVTNSGKIISHSIFQNGHNINNYGTIQYDGGFYNTGVILEFCGSNIIPSLSGANNQPIQACSPTTPHSASVFTATPQEIQNTIYLEKRGYDFAINEKTNTIYVTHNFNNGLISVIDGTTNKIVQTIPVGLGPGFIAVNQETNMIYITYGGPDHGEVSVIDGTTNKIVQTIPVGSFPMGVTINEKTNTIYVANQNGNSVSVIDGTTNKIVQTIPVGSFPDYVAVNEKTNRIYVPNSTALFVIDGTTNKIVQTIPVGTGLDYVAVNQATNMMYVDLSTAEGPNLLSVIDGTTNKIVQNIPVGSAPIEITVNEKTNTVYVANYHSDSISVVQFVSNAYHVVNTISTGHYPESIRVNSNTNTIYVLNENGYAISIISEPLTNSVFTATQQDIHNINQAKANQTIAAEVNVGVNQSTTTIDNNVSVQTTSNTPDSLNINVSASSQTGPKVIAFNLEATTINVQNLKDLGVMYDGKPISPAPNIDAILHAKSTDNPSFAIIVTQSGVQVLVLVPHFSTHSITITNMSKVIPAIPEFPFSILALIIATFSIVLVPKIRYR